MIIIGGGIAGLSAGCYAQMNGFQTRVFETHDIPGGLCTAWKRTGYTFGNCIHWLCESSHESSLNQVWREIGIVRGRQFVHDDIFIEARNAQGEKFTVYADPEKLRKEMLRLAPEDEEVIGQIIKDVRKFMRLKVPLDVGLSNIISALSFVRAFKKYSMPARELSSRFSNQTMRELFDLAFTWHDQMTAFLLYLLGRAGSGDAGYPLGGSLPIAFALEQRYISLGGEVRYKTRVSKVLVENDRAVGVRFADGSEQRADIVLSAADGHATIFEMLDGKYLDDKMKELYQNLKPFPPVVHISFGVKGDFSALPHCLRIKPKESLQMGGRRLSTLVVRNYSDDPNMAPVGSTVFTVSLESDWEYWAKLADDEEGYRKEKEDIKKQVLEALDFFVPGFSSAVVLFDVATPVTYNRYTGNWKGSYQGWQWTKESFLLNIPQTLPGLQGFYMAGHWTIPGGGLPGAAISARSAIKLICKHEKKRFTSNEP